MAEPAPREWARHWQYEGLPGLDLLRGHHLRHTFRPHSHEGFTLGAVSGGAQAVSLPKGGITARPGSVVMINPEVPHSARAGAPEGWAYSALYPSVELISEVAHEVTTLRGTPGFRETIIDDPRTAELIRGVHQAAEAGNALAADSLLRVALARLLARHGGRLPTRTPQDPGARTAAMARALLEEHLTGPPPLEELAREVGTSPFALLRAFKAAYGMPPHTWLTDARVRRARRLLDSGSTAAEAAVAVGFTDQSHLNRHFTRIVGVPPGAYRRERAPRAPSGRPVARKNVQDR
ncbi:AraC family transcriptional regulator [Streptomyces jumonjinensis]|uniref:AraC family transcriptional regulator n=1 Tax=Streptomyces jumonjinensis TaxID=1945 RepID=UPI002B1F8C9E|nr:AraC family transcriptional regulator [Streptomyces jumonjinensis]